MGRRLDKCNGDGWDVEGVWGKGDDSSFEGEGGVVPKGADVESPNGDVDEAPNASAEAVAIELGIMILKWSPAPMCAVCLKSVGGPIILRSILGLCCLGSGLGHRTFQHKNSVILLAAFRQIQR